MAFASGFEVGISMASRKRIEDWEARAMADHLALGKDKGKVNHYWLVKNIFDIYLDEVSSSCREAKAIVVVTRAQLTGMADQFKDIENSFYWAPSVVGK